MGKLDFALHHNVTFHRGRSVNSALTMIFVFLLISLLHANRTICTVRYAGRRDNLDVWLYIASLESDGEFFSTFEFMAYQRVSTRIARGTGSQHAHP
jgi:hypothetical protein